MTQALALFTVYRGISSFSLWNNEQSHNNSNCLRLSEHVHPNPLLLHTHTGTAQSITTVPADISIYLI